MIYQKIGKVQAELKAPKGQYNSFGKYNYRSCEDIIEAVKPLLAREGLVLNISDEICLIGDRYYVKATAVVFDVTDGSSISATAFAREEENKKGMDSSQVTGACSSYARKYALNGLFGIDDSKLEAVIDADDADGKHRVAEAKKAEQKAQPKAQPVSSAEQAQPKCEVCGKEVSEKYAVQGMQKYGHVWCSKECKAQAESFQPIDIGMGDLPFGI